MDVIERSCLVVNAKFSFVYFSISLHLSTLFSWWYSFCQFHVPILLLLVGLGALQNKPISFPGQMSQEATEPG